MEENKTTTTPDNKPTPLDTALGVGVSLAVLFGLVWVISKAWKKGQQA